jgi:hypothetical protein
LTFIATELFDAIASKDLRAPGAGTFLSSAQGRADVAVGEMRPPRAKQACDAAPWTRPPVLKSGRWADLAGDFGIDG